MRGYEPPTGKRQSERGVAAPSGGRDHSLPRGKQGQKRDPSERKPKSKGTIYKTFFPTSQTPSNTKAH